MAIFTPGDDLKRKEQEKLDLMNRQKNYGTYTESDYIKNLRDRALSDKSALDNYGDFQFSKQAMYDQLENSIMNRKPFQYDLDGDALYQMYKDKYIKGGKLAMQDTMGQAAALTGGYGNSYASTAGNQAYQAYLGKLNDVVPELYQLALQRYQLEGDEAKDRLSLLAADRATEYGEYGDRYNRLGDTYNRNYALYGDERGREQSSFEEGYSRLSDALSNAQSEYDSAYNRAYQDFRNNIADQQFNQQLYARNSGGGTENKDYNLLVKGIAEAKKEGDEALYRYLDGAKELFDSDLIVDALYENGKTESFYNNYNKNFADNVYNSIVKAIRSDKKTPAQKNSIIQTNLEYYKAADPEVYKYLVKKFSE